MTKNFKRPPEFYAGVVALKGQMTASKVGEKFGLTKNAVIGIWHRAKAPPLNDGQWREIRSNGMKKHAPEFYPPIIALKGKKTAAEVGEQFGITKNTVIGIWCRAKLPAISTDKRSEMLSRGARRAWERRKSGEG